MRVGRAFPSDDDLPANRCFLSQDVSLVSCRFIHLHASRARSPGMVSQVSTAALRASLTSRALLSASKRTQLILRSSRSCVLQQRSLSSGCGTLAHPTTYEAHPKRPIRWSSGSNARSYATAAKPGPQLPKDIAVLGGGLTGLTTAYYLTRFHPTANITIYEATDRLGGWIDTERVAVKTQEGEHATISFERGARTVAPQSSQGRWEDFVLFDLV